MPKYTQEDRMIAISTPLGVDSLLLEVVAGREAISELFEFQLELLAEPETTIAFDKVLGQAVTMRVDLPDGTKRFINGIVNRFAQAEELRGPHGDVTFIRYRASVVPKLWLLTRRARCRIFQHVAVPAILREVLTGLDVTFDLRGTYEPRDYCVQYRETDFAFASRMMEEEGIYYYFDHADGKHTMIVADTPQGHLPGQIADPVIYEGALGGNRPEDRILSWVKTQEIRSGKSTLWDHCFELPGQNLQGHSTTQEAVAVGTITHKLQVGGNAELELYDYPGGYAQRFDGTQPGGGDRPADVQKIFQDNARTTGIRMQQETVQGVAIYGEGTVRHMSAGHTFSLTRHYNANGDYVITQVDHRASVAGAYGSGQTDPVAYTNQFKCIPAALPFRPAQVTEKGRIHGTQSAVVVGPSGEEIFTDKYSRVKVQFPWDREGQKNADSSCWVRVSTFWAGKKWGAIHIPRIGQEVVVAFEEGDPDKPIIVGSVYNAEQMPPFDLPAERTTSGIKSRSSLNGTTENFNELTFEDKKGQENIYFHAEKDFERFVENNDYLNVGFREGGAAPDKGNRDVTVFNNETISIGNPHKDGSNPYDGSQLVYIWNNHEMVVGEGKGKAKDGSQLVSIWNNQELAIGKGQGQSKEGSQVVSIWKDRTVTIQTGDDTLTVSKGKRTSTIEKDDVLTIKSGDRKSTLDKGHDKLEVAMGNQTTAIKMGNQTTKLDLGKAETEAMQSIEFKVGQSSIKIDQMGVTIKGMMIKIEGQIQTQVKGLMTSLEGTAMTTVKGGITMIN